MFDGEAITGYLKGYFILFFNLSYYLRGIINAVVAGVPYATPVGDPNFGAGPVATRLTPL